MSSDDRERKRTGLAGQIEVEIVRDQYSNDSTSLFSSSAASNPLSILKELIEQVEELEQHAATSTDRGLVSPQELQQHLARFQKQNSVLKRMLDKMH